MTFPSNIILDMYLEGKHPDVIARMLRLSSKQVYKVCAREYAPEGGWVKGFPSSLERAKIRAEFLAGSTMATLSSHYNRPLWTIHKVLKGVPKGIAALPDAPKETPREFMLITPVVHNQPKPTLSEKINTFFRRIFCG